MLAVEVAGLDWIASALPLAGGVVLTLGLVLTIWAGWVCDPRAATVVERRTTDRPAG